MLLKTCPRIVVAALLLSCWSGAATAQETKDSDKTPKPDYQVLTRTGIRKLAEEFRTKAETFQSQANHIKVQGRALTDKDQHAIKWFEERAELLKSAASGIGSATRYSGPFTLEAHVAERIRKARVILKGPSQPSKTALTLAPKPKGNPKPDASNRKAAAKYTELTSSELESLAWKFIRLARTFQSRANYIRIQGRQLLDEDFNAMSWFETRAQTLEKTGKDMLKLINSSSSKFRIVEALGKQIRKCQAIFNGPQSPSDDELKVAPKPTLTLTPKVKATKKAAKKAAATVKAPQDPRILKLYVKYLEAKRTLHETKAREAKLEAELNQARIDSVNIGKGLSAFLAAHPELKPYLRASERAKAATKKVVMTVKKAPTIDYKPHVRFQKGIWAIMFKGEVSVDPELVGDTINCLQDVADARNIVRLKKHVVIYRVDEQGQLKDSGKGHFGIVVELDEPVELNSKFCQLAHFKPGRHVAVQFQQKQGKVSDAWSTLYKESKKHSLSGLDHVVEIRSTAGPNLMLLHLKTDPDSLTKAPKSKDKKARDNK